MRRDGRVAEGTPLLRVQGSNLLESSNLSLSAIFYSSRTHEHAKPHPNRMKLRKLNHVFKDFPLVDPKKVLEKEECKTSCYIANKEKLEKEFETYQCDEQGYYIIRNEKLLRAVSTVQYMQASEK
jgi:hypothetical protein